MALPYTFTNTGHPTIDADQVNSNFTYLDTGKPRENVVTVPADESSTTTVTYLPAFANATTVLRGITFVNYTGTDFATLVYQITNLTKSGFTILVGGGQSGTTVDVHYSAIGD